MAALKLVWDPATGQYVKRNDGSGATTTTAPAVGPFAPVTLPAGIGPEQLAALGLGPQATTTTGAPKPVKTNQTPTTTTTTVPSVKGGRGAPPPTIPRGRGSGATGPTTTTTAPAKPATPVVPITPVYNSRGNPLAPVEGANAGAADAGADGTGDNASGLFGGTGSSSSSTAATKAATNAQNYAQGAQAAKYLLNAANRSMQNYTDYGNTAYQNMLNAANPSYDAQVAKLRETLGANQATGEKQISDAQAALMAQLKPDTTYQNAPVVQLTPEQQALGNALQAYGANDQLAQNASASQQEINKQIADMFRNTNTQLNQAQQNYYTGMQNAAAQNAAEAKTNLATNTTAALQQALGQVESNRTATINSAEQARQQFANAGLTAGQQGMDNYANAMAKLIASYGAPKKKTTKKVK